MKKSFSSVLSIILVFVFAFMAVASNKNSGKKPDTDDLPFGLGEFFGSGEEPETTDLYGFSEKYETYPEYTFSYTEETESSTVTTTTTTTTQPTTTKPVTTKPAVKTPTTKRQTTTRPTTTRPTTTRPTTTRPTTTRKITTTVPSSNVSLNSSNTAAVVSFYNDAVRSTYSNGAPVVYQTMGLRGNITGSGGIAPYISELQKILETDTAAFSGAAYGIPGEDDVESNSVSKASATSSGGKTRIYIEFKDFSVTMEDIDNIDPGELPEEFNDIFADFSSSVVSGRDTVRLSLSNSYIDCTVDERTGKIIDGTWNYDVDFVFGNAEMKLSDVTLSLIDFCIPMRLRVTL